MIMVILQDSTIRALLCHYVKISILSMLQDCQKQFISILLYFVLLKSTIV